MSDRRRRGEDDFADESPWPDDNPNDYRWAQDLAREAREEAREEERRGRHSAAQQAPADPYQQPRVPPQVPRTPAPREVPAGPHPGYSSGPMPTVPAETYNRAARRGAGPADPRSGHPSGPMPAVPAGDYDRGGRGGPPADPRTGHPSGPMPTVPAGSYDQTGRRGGPLRRGRPGPDGGYPPESGGGTGSRAGQGSLPAGDEYRAPGGGDRRTQSGGGGYPSAGERRTGPQDAYDPARDRRLPPGDRRAEASRPDQPGRYPEPSGRRPGQPDPYADPAARRFEPPARRGDPAGPYGDPRGQRGPYGDPAGRDRQQEATGQGRGRQDRRLPPPGQPGDRRAGLTAQYRGRRDRGPAAPPGYGDDVPGPGGLPLGRPDRPAGGYDDGYQDQPGGGSGFFDGLREDQPGGSGRGRGRRGGDGGGWDGGRGQPRKRRGGRVGGLAALIILLIIGTPLIVGGYFLYHAYEAHYNPPNYSGNGTGQVTFQVLPGDNAFSVANRLVTDGVVASARALEIAAEKVNNGSGLQPGFYRLHKHMSADAAWALLLKPSSRVQLTVTIPEGLRVSQTLAVLAKHSGIPISAYQAAIKHPSALGLPSYANNNPEGYLYPATYQIQPNATAASVLKQMVGAFSQEAAGASLTQAAKAVNLTPAQVIVVASLAQAEAGKNSDMPKIARVIYNRLQQGMALDFDSTVLFALNTYGILASDQQLHVNSPYNTYTHKGLPPGPIDSPGNVAIQAALHPASGSWLYFVDVNPKTKDTVFTSSEAQFEQLRAELAHNLGG